MSAQTFMEAFAPAEARYRAEVYKATWGHLAPKRHKTYRGHVVFAFGCFGNDHLNATVIECEMGVDASPWFFDALTDFLATFGGDEAIGLHRWDGTFRNYEFKGAVRRIDVASITAGEGDKT